MSEAGATAGERALSLDPLELEYLSVLEGRWRSARRAEEGAREDFARVLGMVASKYGVSGTLRFDSEHGVILASGAPVAR